MISLRQDAGIVGRCLERLAGALRPGLALEHGEAGATGRQVLSPGLDRPLVDQDVGRLNGIADAVPCPGRRSPAGAICCPSRKTRPHERGCDPVGRHRNNGIMQAMLKSRADSLVDVGPAARDCRRPCKLSW
jgi:hypothetical protein